MKSAILLASFFSLIITPLFAQQSDSLTIKKFYEENTIQWLGGNKYFKGVQSFPLRNLKNEKIYSRDAAYELRQFSNNRTAYNILAVASTSLLLSSIFVKDRDTRLGLTAGWLVTFGVAIPLGAKSTRSLHRFIWLQNRDILLQ